MNATSVVFLISVSESELFRGRAVQHYNTEILVANVYSKNFVSIKMVSNMKF